jgi:hypothetical protein
MADAERKQLLDALHEGRAALGQALAGLDVALETRRPSTGGWSILECMEHMAESERYLLSRLRIATPVARAQANPVREAKIAARARDRSRSIEAPPMVRPHGRYGSLGEALAAFDEARAEVIRYLETCTGDLRCLVTDHPLIPGPVTCYETLVMIAAHPGRHALQIAEIRTALAVENLHREAQC